MLFSRSRENLAQRNKRLVIQGLCYYSNIILVIHIYTYKQLFIYGFSRKVTYFDNTYS